MSRSATTWDWFRLHNADWSAQEVATLDLAAQGFLFLLLRRMLDQMAPVSMDVIRMLARQHRMNKKSVDRLIETFVERGLLHSTDAGFWCDIAEREFVFRDAKAENISKRNAKVSQKRWEKEQQNQRELIPEEERDIERQPPSGSASSTTPKSKKLDARATNETAPSVAPIGASGAPLASDMDEFDDRPLSEIDFGTPPDDGASPADPYDGPEDEADLIHEIELRDDGDNLTTDATDEDWEVDPFGDLDDHTPLPAPPDDQIEAKALSIVGAIGLEPALFRQLRKYLVEGALTRAKADKILSLGTTEGNDARFA